MSFKATKFSFAATTVMVTVSDADVHLTILFSFARDEGQPAQKVEEQARKEAKRYLQQAAADL